MVIYGCIPAAQTVEAFSCFLLLRLMVCISDWQHIDGNALTVEIVASHEHLYQRHNNGEIWVYTGSGKSKPEYYL